MAKSKLYFWLDIGSTHCFAVKLTTKSSSVSWKIGRPREEDICYGSGYEFNQEYDVVQCCLPPGRYQLTCEVNSYSLGGGYIEIDGKRYCEGYIEDGKTEEIIRQGTNKKLKKIVYNLHSNNNFV